MDGPWTPEVGSSDRRTICPLGRANVIARCVRQTLQISQNQMAGRKGRGNGGTDGKGSFSSVGDEQTSWQFEGIPEITCLLQKRREQKKTRWRFSKTEVRKRDSEDNPTRTYLCSLQKSLIDLHKLTCGYVLQESQRQLFNELIIKLSSDNSDGKSDMQNRIPNDFRWEWGFPVTRFTEQVYHVLSWRHGVIALTWSSPQLTRYLNIPFGMTAFLKWGLIGWKPYPADLSWTIRPVAQRQSLLRICLVYRSF